MHLTTTLARLLVLASDEPDRACAELDLLVAWHGGLPVAHAEKSTVSSVWPGQGGRRIPRAERRPPCSASRCGVRRSGQGRPLWHQGAALLTYREGLAD